MLRHVTCLAVVALLGWAAAAPATEFAALYVLPDEDGIYGIGDHIIFRIDTVAPALQEIYQVYGQRLVYVTAGPEETIFFRTLNQLREAGEYVGEVQRIYRVVPDEGYLGEPAYVTQTVVYELELLEETEVEEGEPAGIGKLAIGPGDGPDDYSVYFEDGGVIYRVLDTHTVEPFYEVDYEDLTEGLSCVAGTAWKGDFVFDEEGNLYLSTGNTIPSGLSFVDRGATGEWNSPRFLVQRDDGGMSHLAYEPGSVYFSNPDIYRVDLATLAIETVYSNEGRVGDLGVFPEGELRRPPREKRLPDARPSDLWLGEPYIKDDDPFEIFLPVRFVVENLGDLVDGELEVAFAARVAGGQPLKATFLPVARGNRPGAWLSLPAREAPVAMGGELLVRVPKGLDLKGQTLLVSAMVDACDQAGAKTTTCRVEESDEANNRIETKVRMPAKRMMQRPGG